jgi:tetratricopeptide (TPR) repeat protein
MQLAAAEVEARARRGESKAIVSRNRQTGGGCARAEASLYRNRRKGIEMTMKLASGDRLTTTGNVLTVLLFAVALTTSGTAYCQAIKESERNVLGPEQKEAYSNYFDQSRLANNAGMDQLIARNYPESERMLQLALDSIRKIPAVPIPSNPKLLTRSDVAAYQDIVARVTFEGAIAHNLGQVYFRQKKYKEAEAMYKISTTAAEANPLKTSLKEYLVDLESLYLAIGNEQLAKEARSRIQAAEAKR